MRPGIVVLTVATAVAAGAVPAAAAGPASVATTWRGWTAGGAVDALGSLAPVTASGSTTLRVGGGTFLLERPGGDLVGTLPDGRPTLVAPDRILSADACTISRSDDFAATWTAVALPGCQGTTDPPALAFAGPENGLASTVLGTWGTTDGGRTWTRRSGPASLVGAPILRPDGVALRVVQPVADARSFERSADAGATWTRIDLPADPAPPSVPPPAVPTPVGSVRVLTGPAGRADGAVLLGVPGAVLVSADAGRSFERVPLPEALGGPLATVSGIACDPVAPTCVIGSTGGASAVLGPAGFGPRLLPALPASPVAPAPGVIVGTEPSSPAFTVRRSDDGGASYATTGGSVEGGRDADGPGLLVIPLGQRLRVSTDRGGTWTDVPAPPAADAVRRVVRRGARGLLAIAGDALHAYDGARWLPSVGLADLRATGVTTVGGTPLVVGDRGVAWVRGGSLVPVSAPVLDGRSLAGVAARGRTVVAWSAEQVVRSGDGGRTWARARGIRGADTLLVLDGRTVLAVRSGTFSRSTDGGRSFRRLGRTPRLASRRSGDSSAMDFTSRTRGVLRTPDGVFRTGDGGRSFAPVPMPVPATAASAVAVADRGIVVRAGGLVLRTTAAGTVPRPALDVHRAGAPTRAGKNRRVVVRGRLRGAPAGARVVLVTSAAPTTDGVPSASVVVGADGTYRIPVLLGPRERFVRAWYGGLVERTRTTPATSSPAARIPALARPAAPRPKARRR